MTTEPMPIRIVEGLTTTNETGRIVSVMPARYVDADTAVDEIGNAIETVPFEEVDGLITLNSAGQAVPVIPVRIVEGLTALNEANQLVGVLALRGAGAPSEPPITLRDPAYYDTFDYADGTRLVAGDPNANAGLVATNPGNLGWTATASGSANNARFNPIVVGGKIVVRTANAFGDFASPASYALQAVDPSDGVTPVAVGANHFVTITTDQTGSQRARAISRVTNASNYMSLDVTRAGAILSISRIANAADTTHSVSGDVQRRRFGGANGAFYPPGSNEKFSLIVFNGKGYVRRGHGSPIGSAAGFTINNLSSGTGVGIDTRNSEHVGLTAIGAEDVDCVLKPADTHNMSYPRVQGLGGYANGAAEVTTTWTYEGTAPEHLAWLLVDPFTDAIVKDPERVEASKQTIGGGNISITTIVPCGEDGRLPYKIGICVVGADGVVVPGTMVCSNVEFAVTYTMPPIGQSNAGGLLNNAVSGNYQDYPGAYYYTKFDPPSLVKGTFGATTPYMSSTTNGTGDKMIARFGDTLSTHLNLPVSFEAMALAATSATNLGPNGSNWDYILAHHAMAGGAFDALYFSHGEASFTAAGDQWLAAWQVNIPAYLALSGQPSGTIIPIFFAFTGRVTGSNSQSDVSAQQVRLAQDQFAATFPNAVPAHHYVGVKMVDDFHYTNVFGEGYDEVARRLGLSVKKYLTGTGYDGMGPLATTATRAGAVITIDFDLNGATSMTCRNGTDQSLTGTASALTSWQVSTDDFATTKTISTAELIGNQVVITLSADPGGPVKVRNHYGFAPTITSWAFGSYADGSYIGSKPIITPLVSN